MKIQLSRVCESEIDLITTRYFCNTEAYLGYALFEIDSERGEVAPIKHAPAGAILVGISLNNVCEVPSNCKIPMDVMPMGRKVQILLRGNIIISLPPLKIPSGQPLYINQDGQITWKYSIYKVGKTISNQDKDGYVKVRIDIDN